MHVESGCHRITRHHVTAAVHELNVIPRISIGRLIGRTTSPPRVITYSANSSAYNGHGYECYICHSTFKTLGRLNQHLSSPTHDSLEFRCPRCASEFQLISALVQHIESGCCGIAKFNQIVNQFQNLTNKFSRLLAFWLYLVDGDHAEEDFQICLCAHRVQLHNAHDHWPKSRSLTQHWRGCFCLSMSDSLLCEGLFFSVGVSRLYVSTVII